VATNARWALSRKRRGAAIARALLSTPAGIVNGSGSAGPSQSGPGLVSAGACSKGGGSLPEAPCRVSHSSASARCDGGECGQQRWVSGSTRFCCRAVPLRRESLKRVVVVYTVCGTRGRRLSGKFHFGGRRNLALGGVPTALFRFAQWDACERRSLIPGVPQSRQGVNKRACFTVDALGRCRR
jgi:hypothetical protein